LSAVVAIPRAPVALILAAPVVAAAALARAAALVRTGGPHRA
jgi:hypothetical protein